MCAVGVLILSLQGLSVTNGRTFRLMGGKSVALQRLLLLISLQRRRRPPLPADTLRTYHRWESRRCSRPCIGARTCRRRQSFPTLLLLLSSVIKGRGKSRGEGCALIAFHGREEKAAARPEGPRRCSALCCLLERETLAGSYAFVVSRYRHVHVRSRTGAPAHCATHTR